MPTPPAGGGSWWAPVPVPVPVFTPPGAQVVAGGAQILKMFLLIFGLFRPEPTHFEARFGILVKNYTILTNDHRNRAKLDPFRGNFSEPVANQVPEGCGRGVGSELRGHPRLWGRMVG